MSEANQTGRVSLGIDVTKAKFDVAFLRPGKLARRTFAMDANGFAALATWVRHQGAELKKPVVWSCDAIDPQLQLGERANFRFSLSAVLDTDESED
jgi:hypothetical protein